MTRETHSDKALKTLTLMGTVPEEWAHVPIKYVLEDQMWPEAARCPDCVHGEAWLTPKGEPHNFFKHCKGGLSGFEKQAQIEKYSLTKGKCPTCPTSRNSPWRGTGEVIKYKMRKVWVGYVQWVEGTLFDSRFEDALYNTNRTSTRVRHICGLCSKSILDPFGIIPVHGKDSAGRIHGMWIGRDCGRKFLGVKDFKNPKAKRGDRTMLKTPLTKT